MAFGTVDAMRAAFESLHRRRFGFVAADKILIVESLEAEATGRSGSPGPAAAAPITMTAPPPIPAARIRMAGADQTAAIVRRESLSVGAVIDGPAIVLEQTGTTVIEPGWRGTTGQP